MLMNLDIPVGQKRNPLPAFAARGQWRVFLDRLRDEITLLSTCYLTPVMPISATERPTGVSRTSKTLSIYLANRGIRTANGPLVPGIPVPHQAEKLTRTLVVSLHATPGRLIQVPAELVADHGRRFNDASSRRSITLKLRADLGLAVIDEQPR